MKQRVLFGGLMLIGLVALLCLDYWLGRSSRWGALPLGVLIAVLVAVGAVELVRLARMADVPVMPLPAIVMAAALAAAPLWVQWLPHRPANLWLPAAPLVVIVAFACQMAAYRLASPITRLGTTILIAIYLGGCGACILALRITVGMPAFVVFLAAVKFTDIGAYFTGSAIGRYKLIPWLSPGKSWEGLAGGLLAGVVVAVLIWWILMGAGHTIIGVWKAALFALAMGLAGQFGDLCESLLKRAASAKDAGRLVPQFGGVMDIIDSPLMAGPVGLALSQLVF